MAAQDAVDVLGFWWAAGPAKWFNSDPAFDDAVRDTLLPLHEAAAAGRLDGWEATPHGRLALILLTDQVPRNVFRGTPRAFATDPIALGLAGRALDRRDPDVFPMPARMFFWLPFEHAEDMAAQERSVDLFRTCGSQEAYLYALVHLDAIRRFGRFPHRNAILGRKTTAEEEAWLSTGGFRG